MCKSLKKSICVSMSVDPSFLIFFCFVFGINSLQQGFIAPAEVSLSLTKQCETQFLLQGTYILIRESTFASGPFFIVSLKASSRLHGFSLRVLEQRTQNIGLSRIGMEREQRYWGVYGESIIISCWAQKEGRPRCVSGVGWRYHEDAESGSWTWQVEVEAKRTPLGQ